VFKPSALVLPDRLSVRLGWLAGRRWRRCALGLMAPVAVILLGLLAPGMAFASPPSTAIRYDYDADGQLKGLVNPASETALYTWDPAGNLLSIGLKSSKKLSILVLAPTQGAVGETVRISGTAFSATASEDKVKFNGTTATVSAASEWSLTVTVPSGATSGTVTVQTKSEGPVTSAQSFTVASSPAPKITSLSSNLATAGAEVTVSGSNFEANAYNDLVLVNRSRSELVSESPTAIKFKVPGATGSGPVAVATPQGAANGPDLFIPPNGISTSKIGATGELSLGGSATVKVSKAAEDYALETFAATAGQLVSIVASEASYHGWVSVWGPEGTKVSESEMGFWSGENPRLDGPITLATTGTYTILVQPNEAGATGSVKLSAYSVTNVKGSITPTTAGAATNVSLNTPGQQALYTVSGTASESVSLKTSSTSFPPEGGYVEWKNPEGITIASDSFSSTENEFIKQVRFATTGTYTLVVHPYGVSTGSLTLTAYNASDVTGSITPSAEGETKTVTIGVPGQFARYTFSGTEGQRVSLVAAEASYHGWASVWGPEGMRVSESEVGFGSGENPRLDGPFTLPATGTYTILIEPEGGATGSVKLSAYSVTNVKGSITPTTAGAATNVSLKTPGQQALYTVSGTAGESVSLKTSSTSFPPEGGYVEWENPEGITIESYSFSSTENRFMRQVKFATTGTYTLVVHPYGVSTGSLTLTAYNASDVTGSITPTAAGETKTVTIGVPGQFARYTFSGTEKQTITLKARESTIANGWMSVWNPEGSSVSGSEANFSGSGASVEITLPTTGTYTILLEPVEGDTGSVKLTAYLGSHPDVVRGPRDAGSVAAPSRPTPHLLDTLASKRVTRSTAFRRAHVALTLSAEARAKRLMAGSITPEMRRFRPRGPARWQPPARRDSGGVESGQKTPWTKIARLQGLYGATAVSGQVLAQDGLPIAGVRVAIEGTYLAAQTDEAGRFLLSGAVPSGHRVLVVEGEKLPAGQRYGTYEIGVQIAAHKTTMLPYTIWLTPLDPAGDTHIDSPSTHEVRLTTPQIPGLEVRIPAGSVITDREGHTVHSLNVTALPVDRPPFPLPPWVSVPLYFTVQPGGAWLSRGAQIVYPNSDHLAPGERVDFWNYDPASRGWYVYGKGTVTPNGKQVMPDPGTRIWELTGAMWQNSPGLPGRGPKSGGNGWGGDPVDFRTGLFVYHKTDLVLPDVIPIKIERTYRQGDSNSYSFGVGTTSLYDIRLWSNNEYKEVDLVLPNGGAVRYLRTSPGEGYEEAELASTSTSGPYYDSKIKWDRSEPGWDLTLTDGITYVFGEVAPLQAIRDRYGNQLTITREDGQHGNITQITSPHGRWVRFTYNSSSDVTEIKDNGGQTLKYAYNKAGLLETATDAAGRTTSYEYSSAGEMTSVKDGRGKVYIETEYETHERVAKQKLGNGGTYSFAYTENGSGEVESTTVTDPREVKRKVTFNSEGYPTKDVNALGTSLQETTSYEPEAGSGLPLSVTDPLGRKTTYKYDSAGNITQMTLLAGTSSARTLEYTYEPGTNELASYTNALKHKTTYHYGEHGELLSETDPLKHTTSYEYNVEGQPTAIKSALGKTTKLSYEFGDLTAVTDPLGRTTKRFVDELGRTGSIIAPEGQRTLYEYNQDGQVTKVTDPLGATTSYEYDGDGDLVASTDPNKHRSSSTYSPMDLLESETDPLEHTTKGVYDPEGQLTELTDRDGKVSKFSYDALDRLTEARFGVSGESAESTIKYEYDLGNRLTKIVDSATGTYTPEYDEFNRLKSLATPNGTIKYEYNEANQRTSMTAPGAEAVKYSYDEAGRLTELKRGSQVVSLAYNEANLPTKTTLPDGIEESYGYDEANELTSIAYTKGATKLGELDYSYTLDGLREAMWGSYARTGLPEAISSAAYNADNEQTERNSKKLGYDAEGNLTSDGSSEYKWNARGQLAEITGATKASFTYDPFGRRVSKTLSGTTTKLLPDGPNVAQETQGTSTTNVLSGLAPNQVFARTTSTATESLLAEALGSTIGIGTSAGKVETSYTYDPFGATSKEGTASENPFQYTGGENDGDGLYNDRARYYSPAAARFISQDPLGEEANGPNLYRYVDNSPTNAIDPYGTNLRAPTPTDGSVSGAPAGGSSGASGGAGSAGVGGSSGNNGSEAPGGGFGPSPGGCGPMKGGGGSLGTVATCRKYEKLEKVEEEIRKEKEKEEGRKSPWEVLEDTVKTVVPVVKGCLAGGTYGAYEFTFIGQPEVGAAVGCAAGGAINYVTETNGFP